MRDVRGSALLELTRVRLLEVVREPEALFWMFVFPVIMAVALGIAFPSRTTDSVIVGVVEGPGAPATVAALSAAAGVETRTLRPGEIETAVRRASVQIVIEPGSPPTYRYDPARAESRLARRIVDDVLQRAGGRQDAWCFSSSRPVCSSRSAVSSSACPCVGRGCWSLRPSSSAP